MRSSIVLIIMFTASLVYAAANDYVEIRDLDLSAADVDVLEIEAGAGSLTIQGEPGLSDIAVSATIEVPGRGEDKARSIIESDLVLTLEKSGQIAKLKSYFTYHGRGDSPVVHIEVQVPERLQLDIEDGSGSMSVTGVSGNIKVDDSSGSIKMSSVGGDVVIEDSSGSIDVEKVGANLDIRDSSGSIKVQTVGGSVTVDDGSGSINVRDVEHDLIIIDDSAGSLKMTNIRGRVETDEY
jgi:hypothetical protein